MRRLSAIAAFLILGNVAGQAHAKDDLLETLAQKGVLTMEEYEKLKAQRKSEITLNTDEGFKLSSADGANTMQVGTLQQLDLAAYHQDRTDLADGTELRRSRLSVGGTIAKDFSYRVEYEFTTTATTGVTDAYVAYNGLKGFTFTAGQFKQPIGMDALASDKNVTFMERALPFTFLPARAPGLMVSGYGSNWSAAAGAFGEPVSTATAGDEGYGVVARGTFAPVYGDGKLIHIGGAALWRRPTADTVKFQFKPETDQLGSAFLIDYTPAASAAVDDYRIEGLELAGQIGAASIQGEVHFVQVARHTAGTQNFGGWYTQIAYTLTGEARPYKPERGIFDGIRPTHNFGKEGWGAFEVAARVSGAEVYDDNSGGREQNAALAFNWYLNPFLRISTNVVKVLDVHGGNTTGTTSATQPYPFQDGNTPTVYQMRLQLAI